MLQVNFHSFSYSKETILKDIQFSLKAGEHLSILGESGCGKSTLLHLIYGLLHLENGEISYSGKQLLGPTKALIPGEKFMKLVAQDFNLMPFSTVAENISSHLTGLNKEEDTLRIAKLLKAVNLENFENKLVKTLSGGQKQRTALAKALAQKPEILLLDEPFSNIDAFQKNKLRRSIYSYLKQNNISCITATHDSEEALAFSDKICMLKNGKILKYGSAQEVYENASTEYELGFFGEVTNLPKDIFSSEEMLLLPHQLEISKEETPLYVQVSNSYFKGDDYLIEAKLEGNTIFFKNSESIETGKFIYLKKRAEN